MDPAERTWQYTPVSIWFRMLRTVGWRTDACAKNVRSGRMLVKGLASLVIDSSGVRVRFQPRADLTPLWMSLLPARHLWLSLGMMRGCEERVGLERLTVRFKLLNARRPMRVDAQGFAYVQSSQGSLEHRLAFLATRHARNFRQPTERLWPSLYCSGCRIQQNHTQRDSDRALEDK